MMKKICDFISRWMGALVLVLAILALLVPAALPPDLALGVILVGCCPGGTASNVITYLAKGDLALSVGMTATSTVLAPLLTPSLTWLMADTFVDVDAVGMLLSIVYVVIVPIIGGFLIQHFLPHFTKHAVAYLPAFSSLMIASLVAIIVGHNASKLRRHHRRIGSHSAQSLWFGHRLFSWLFAPTYPCQAVSHLCRGGYAELRSCHIVGHDSFLDLSDGSHPRSHFQCMA